MQTTYNQQLLSAVIHVLIEGDEISDFDSLANQLNRQGITTKTGKLWKGNTLMRTIHRIPDEEKEIMNPFEEGTLSRDGLYISHFRESHQKYWH